MSWGQRRERPITALFFERQTLPIYFPFRAISVNNASTTSTITSGSTFDNDSTTTTPRKTKTGTRCISRPRYVFLSSLTCSMLTYTQGGFSSTFFFTPSLLMIIYKQITHMEREQDTGTRPRQQWRGERQGQGDQCRDQRSRE